MKLLEKRRASVEGQEIDFIFLPDAEFKLLIQEGPQSFLSENQEEGVAVVLVGYPSKTSVVPAGIDFSMSLLEELYP